MWKCKHVKMWVKHIFCQHTFLKKIIVALNWKQFRKQQLIPMLKTALKMIKEVSNPYLFSNFLKTHAENKNSEKTVKNTAFWSSSRANNCFSKNRLHNFLGEPSGYLHAKFQKNLPSGYRELLRTDGRTDGRTEPNA